MSAAVRVFLILLFMLDILCAILFSAMLLILCHSAVCIILVSIFLSIIAVLIACLYMCSLDDPIDSNYSIN